MNNLKDKEQNSIYTKRQVGFEERQKAKSAGISIDTLYKRIRAGITDEKELYAKRKKRSKCYAFTIELEYEAEFKELVSKSKSSISNYINDLLIKEIKKARKVDRKKTKYCGVKEI